MVGGGPGAFIGAVHRMAARLDGAFLLTGGAFSSDPAKSHAMAGELGLDPARCFPDVAAMVAAGALDAVAVVSPNHHHRAAAVPFLEAGVPVICDKPLAASIEDAQAIADAARASGTPCFVTYNYSGYPLVRQMRAMVAAGEIGAVRSVQVEYAQDWLARPIESEGQKQAGWRTDPAATGGVGAIGDIGTHAYHLARFVTGLELDTLAADLSALVPGRRVDDDARILLRFRGGARGMLWASQVAIGNSNGLRLRVHGERGGLEWAQEAPEQLRYAAIGEAPRLIMRGGPAGDDAFARLPAGHPEGFIEAFATLYRDAAKAIRAWQSGQGWGDTLAPTAADGLEGVAFVAAALRSSRADAAWTPLAGATP